MITSEVREKYLNHKEHCRKCFLFFKNTNIEIIYPTAHEVLSDFGVRVDSIFRAIIDLTENDNLYPIYILYRSLLEHFYRAYYILDKTATNKNDETAEDYKFYYLLSEILAEKAGVLEMEDLQNDKIEKTNFLDFVSKIPEFKGFSKTDQQKISAMTKNFSLKNIIKYLNIENKNRGLSDASHVIAKLLPEYSKVSTFTHGGPYAKNIMSNYEKDNDKEMELKRILDISLMCAYLVNEFSFIAYNPTMEFKVIQASLLNARP